MSPRFTVITPTYNRAEWLPKAIRSVLAQTEKDFEYLIIDDGSTDDTRATVEPYLKDPRLTYVYQANGGEPAAVNHGWKMAKGQYFLQVNSDDSVHPQLLREMGKALDAHPEAILAYCDFQSIDEEDRPFEITRTTDWNFQSLLKQFSCVAAAPATTFRRSALAHWKKLRQSCYRYINDVEMYWSMALEGPFLHVPQVLANWRTHNGQISANRVGSIPEIEDWYQRYFSNPSLPEEIKACQAECRKTLRSYYSTLVKKSALPIEERQELLYSVERTALLEGHTFINLQIGDNDLIGNKFNGHNLHLLLQEQGIQSFHLVTRRQSEDPQTYALFTDETHNFASQILRCKEFLHADIVHLHLIHNTNFDLNALPFLSTLKPMVITLHDTFFTGGHCINNAGCDEYLKECVSCPYPKRDFVRKENLTAYECEQKRVVFQNANISAIVGSPWMEARITAAPAFANKKVYRLPFGVDQQLFAPRDVQAAKEALGIDKDSLTLMFRSDRSSFKGLDTIEKALDELSVKPKATLLLVGSTGLMDHYRSRYHVLDFGWVTDDAKLAQLYQACDIFLMPSTQEAFGMMAVEAMSCGKPVLSITGTALVDIIHSPQCGLAVEKDMFSATLQAWVDDPQERRTRGEKSSAFAQENYSIDRYIQGILEIYDDVRKNFCPRSNHRAVLSQLNYIAVSAESMAIAGGLAAKTLCNSSSWRITKPLRALRQARLVRCGGLRVRLTAYRAYMKQTLEQQPADDIILQSTSWKITQPLRKAVSFIKTRILG